MAADSSSPRQYVEELLAGQMQSRTLIVAHRLGLFTTLGRQSCEVVDLAATLRVGVDGLRKLLVTLQGLGLVRQKGQRVKLTKAARDGLLPESDGYFGEFIDFFADQFDSKPVSVIIDHLRRGGPLRPTTTPTQWQHYMAAMDRMAAASAERIAKKMKLEGDQTLLDLGGGPGCYAIAACQLNPQLHATILDLPDALRFAQPNVADAGLNQRITLRCGSVTDFAYGGPYDVIFLSHTIHLFDESTVQRMLNACRASLSPTGRLVLRDLFTDEHRTEPLLGSLIAMHMWNEGDAYSVPQASELLCRAGFQPPKHVQFRRKSDPVILGSLLISKVSVE